MKKTIKKLIKLISLTTLIVCLCIVTGCEDKELNARERITRITDREVPSNSTMVFHKQGDVFVGRAYLYTVFSFEEKPIEFLIDFKTKNVVFEEAYDMEFQSHLTARNSKFDIPNKYRADWNTEYFYLWLDEIGVFFLYLTVNHYLIVFIVAT